MKILLIMNNVSKEPTGVVVALRVKEHVDQVVSLLEENRSREAFEFVRLKSEPLCYVPIGHQLEKYFPVLTESYLV